MTLPPELLARVAHWLYQSGDVITATRLLMTHKNEEFANYCKQLEQPVVFVVEFTEEQLYILRFHGGPVDITIDWGDGNWSDFNDILACVSHVYTPGRYRIRIYARRLNGLEYVANVVEFHTIGNVIRSCADMFAGVDIDTPLIWDTSRITNMSSMFCSSKFNSIIRFNTSNVTTMKFMFASAKNFNQPVNFDTSSCRDMHSMFYNAKEFDKPVPFNTKNVLHTSHMFAGASKFNQPVEFDTSKCISMRSMFYNAECFNQPVNFNTSACLDVECMFYDARNFKQVITFPIPEYTDIKWLLHGTKASLSSTGASLSSTGNKSMSD